MAAAPLPMVWNNFDWNQQRVEEFAHAGSLGNPTGMAVSALILFICGFGVRGSMDRAHRLFDFKSSTELEKIFGTETLIKNVRDLVQANQKVFTAEHWADFGGFDPLGYINKVPQWAKKLETRPEMVEEIRNSSFGNHLPLIASESSDDLDLDPSKIALIFAHIVIREYLHSDEYDKRLPKALARCFIAILYFVNEKKKLAPLGAVYLPPLHNDDLGIDQRFILPLAHIAVILAESPYGKHYLLQQALAQLDRLQRVDQGSTALLLLAMGDSDSPATYRALLKLRAQGHPKADKLIRNALGSSSHRKKLLKAEHQICLLRLVKSDIDPKYLDLSL